MNEKEYKPLGWNVDFRAFIKDLQDAVVYRCEYWKMIMEHHKHNHR